MAWAIYVTQIKYSNISYGYGPYGKEKYEGDWRTRRRRKKDRSKVGLLGSNLLAKIVKLHSLIKLLTADQVAE